MQEKKHRTIRKNKSSTIVEDFKYFFQQLIEQSDNKSVKIKKL